MYIFIHFYSWIRCLRSWGFNVAKGSRKRRVFIPRNFGNSLVQYIIVKLSSTEEGLSSLYFGSGSSKNSLHFSIPITMGFLSHEVYLLFEFFHFSLNHNLEDSIVFLFDKAGEIFYFSGFYLDLCSFTNSIQYFANKDIIKLTAVRLALVLRIITLKPVRIQLY